MLRRWLRLRRHQRRARVVAALLAAPDARHFVYDLRCATGVSVAVIYPLLTDLMEREYVVDGWEAGRRWYGLTLSGEVMLTTGNWS